MQDELNDIQYTQTEDPDILKVCRCKDCRYMRIEGDLTHWFYCEQTNCDTDSRGYCHRAERRTDETDCLIRVVRCRDCKWFHEHEMENPFCGQGVFLNYPRRDDYCSYGERKDG